MVQQILEGHDDDDRRYKYVSIAVDRWAMFFLLSSSEPPSTKRWSGRDCLT